MIFYQSGQEKTKVLHAQNLHRINPLKEQLIDDVTLDTIGVSSTAPILAQTGHLADKLQENKHQ